AVIVVSALASAANVVKALELGALDFVPKPGSEASPELATVGAALAERVAALRSGGTRRVPRLTETTGAFPVVGRPPGARAAGGPARRVVVIGASTGGPGALLEMLSSLPGGLPFAIAVALHMPPGFTAAF